MGVQKTTVGNGLDLYFAVPEGSGPFPAVILFTEGFGLNSDMLEGVVERLAQHGFVGVAPDIFHGVVLDGTDRDAMIAKIRSIKDDEVLAETRETIAWLRSRDDVDGSRIGGIGFCMGGRLAFLAHAELAGDMKASVAYYGGGIAPEKDMLGRTPLLDRIQKMQGPIFLGYGAEDAGITPEEHARIVTALSAAKKRFEFHLYPGAGHAFLSESRPSYSATAASEAWPITIAFLDRYLR